MQWAGHDQMIDCALHTHNTHTHVMCTALTQSKIVQETAAKCAPAQELRLLVSLQSGEGADSQ